MNNHPVLLDGKEYSDKLALEFKKKIKQLEEIYGTLPGLGTILVGGNPASKAYVSYKHKLADRVGILRKDQNLVENSTKEEVREAIKKYNLDPQIHGILLQLPMPSHLQEFEREFIDLIDPEKDVDGLTEKNSAKLYLGEEGLVPCTALGILKLLKHHKVSLEGKNVVIVGRSQLVGKPFFFLSLKNNATVTVTHSKTRNLKQHCLSADILVVAIGKSHFIKGDMIKDGAIVVDVGINRLVDGSLVGDVLFEEAKKKSSMITPVPGGVGPMTVAMVISNTITAFESTRR